MTTRRLLQRRLFLTSAVAAVAAAVVATPRPQVDKAGYTGPGGKKRKPTTGFGVVSFGTAPFGK